jgi:phospho-N-acetylmuramoyl-pentapeptide-transferase
MTILNAVKILLPAAVAFFIGIGITPALTHFLYKHKLWKKKPGKRTMDGKETPLFNNLHATREVGVPKMGGLVIWISTIITTLLFWALSAIFDNLFYKLDFLSRDQTWLPLFTLAVGGIIGLIDDFWEVRGIGDHVAGGLSLKKRLGLISIFALLASLWFFFKLETQTIGVPFLGDLTVGVFFIPIFIAVALAIYSGGIIDGIDGLAGGVFAIIFSAYSVIAFAQNQINLAAFSAVLAGSILAFLWFNIPPARFYMSETGTMSLTMALAIIAFMTDSVGEGHGVLALPIIAIPLVITTWSDIIQVIAKKILGRKVFLIAPLHHHFEAKGWPPYKVTMRYWVIGTIFAVLGVVFALIG